MKELVNSIVPQEKIIHKILLLKSENVMLDSDLAEIYQVETRVLKQAVRRNLELFPADFMFTLTETEIEILVSQNVIPSKQVLGGSLPFVFTEAGVAMLSGVLKSKKAKEMNIAVIRAFVVQRKIFLHTTELRLDIEIIKKKINNNSKNIEYIFQILDELAERNIENKPRSSIGFKSDTRNE